MLAFMAPSHKFAFTVCVTAANTGPVARHWLAVQ